MPVFFLYESKKRSVHLKNDTESFKHETWQLLIKADSVSKLSIWNLKNNESMLLKNINKKSILKISVENIKLNDYQTSLNQFWKENCLNDENDVNKKLKLNFLKILCIKKFGTISTLIYINKINKLVYGMFDGTILIRPAIEFLMNTLFCQDSNLNKSKHFK